MKLNRRAAGWTALSVLGAAALLIALTLGLGHTTGTQAAPLAQGTAAAASGTAAANSGLGAPAGGTVSPALADGRMAYTQMGCANCHGALGQGAIGPQLAGRNLPSGYFLLQVRTPLGVMPPYPSSVLSDTQVAAIAAYVNTLPAPGAGITATTSMTETLQRLGMGLEALRYLQTPDMQKYLARQDLQSALQELQQALGVVQQQLSARATALPAAGTPTPGIQATPAGALPLPLLPTPTTAPPGAAPVGTPVSASLATPGGAALSTPGTPGANATLGAPGTPGAATTPGATGTPTP